MVTVGTFSVSSSSSFSKNSSNLLGRTLFASLIVIGGSWFTILQEICTHSAMKFFILNRISSSKRGSKGSSFIHCPRNFFNSESVFCERRIKLKILQILDNHSAVEKKNLFSKYLIDSFSSLEFYSIVLQSDATLIVLINYFFFFFWRKVQRWNYLFQGC